MKPEIMRTHGVGKAFSGVRVLEDVSLAIRAGEIHALMGENGAGKSTLVRILSGIHTDFDGEIWLDEAPVRFAGTRAAERAGVAIIHQELNLVPELTVAENIFLGREPLLAGLIVDRRATLRAAAELLQRLGLELDPTAKVGKLRVGEQQLVEIAKALSLNARILIMDEPTSALSLAEARRLFAIVRQLAATGVAIVYITHRMDEVFSIADRVTVLRDGRLVASAPAAEMSRAGLISAMVGRELAAGIRHHNNAAGPVVLEATGLSLEVDRPAAPPKRVVDNVHLEARAGEILGIGGLLGAGRTEVLELIFGAAKGRASGALRIDGKPVAIRGPEDAKRAGIGFVTEDRKRTGLLVDFDLRMNTALPSQHRLAWLGIARPDREAALARDAVARLAIRCTGIDQQAKGLSGGNQQKVVLGKWLATAPRILLLDEPTRGIDVGAKQEVYELIERLAAQGLAIVLVSSELPELLRLADRIMVMCEGRVTGVLERAEATQERVMELAAPKALHGIAA